MKYLPPVFRSFSLIVLGGFLLFTGCKSTSPTDGSSRKEYEYVPPVVTTSPDGVVVMEEPSEKEKSGGFFSRMFSKNSDDEAPTGDVQRVGDAVDGSGKSGNRGRPNPAGPSEQVYRLKVGDALYIQLSGSAGLSEQIETIVDDEGAVKLRFIGSVKAVGLTTTVLEREIELEYTERQKIYRDVTARVLVPNTFYFIGGEVKQPGRFPLIGRVTLSQAVVAAGNFTEWANERKVTLVRNNERVILDFRDIMRNPLQDIELLAGDVITVERSAF